MIFHKTKLEGAFIVDLDRKGDQRGFFARAFCQKEFAEHGLRGEVAQASLSYSERRRDGAGNALPGCARD